MNWNERYAQGDTPWEKGSAAPPLQEIVARAGKEVWGEGAVLVPGCGFGHDARWLADRGMDTVGLDISSLALQSARERTEGENPRFECGDFFNAREGAYSTIFEHTCFCAIDPSERKNYVTAAAQWLPVGGHLVAVFFLEPGREGGPPFGVSKLELDELFREEFELLDEWLPAASYPGREGREWVRILRKR